MLHRISARALFLPVLLAGLLASPSRAISPDEVLVVVNDASPVSVAIGAYYQMVRGIPVANVFHLAGTTSTAETIARTTYNDEVRDPVRNYLQTSGLRTQILCIVTTTGVPLRISSSDAVGVNQKRAAVDSELALLFTGQVPDDGHAGWVGNPYFDSEQDFDSFREMGNLYLVTRLTGYQTDPDPGTGVPRDVKALIDRAQVPAPPGQGVYLLDVDPSAFQQGNEWLLEARDALLALGAGVHYDASPVFQRNIADIRGYSSWGSNDHADPGPPYYGEVPPGSGNVYPGTFLPGALTTTMVSTSARTFTDGSQGYGQSLIADLIREGATGCAGHVYEPFLDAVPRPQILFHRWELGYQAAEAFFMATPYLSWENVIVVDPLARVAQFDPPTVTLVEPASGPITGGTRVTITGASFYGQVQVAFGAVRGSQVRRTTPDVVEVTVPEGLAIEAVDITLTTPFGELVIPSGYEYLQLPVAITTNGSPCLGCTFGLVVTGPPLADFALLVDAARGPTTVRGLVLDLGFTRHLRILHDGIRGSDPPLAFPGMRAVPFMIPNNPDLLFRTLHAQAVVKTGPGTFEVSNRSSASIVP